MASKQDNLDAPMVLLNLSKHLSKLAKNIGEVEAATSKLLEYSMKPEDSTVLQLQFLDFARQSLEDCSILVEHLSTNSVKENNQPIDQSNLRRRIKLDSTKSLLCVSEAQNKLGCSGDVDVF